MSQAYTERNESELFESRKDAERHLESYAFGNGGDCQYANDELQHARVDGAVVRPSEYGEGWGFEVSDVDCQDQDLGDEIKDHLNP